MSPTELVRAVARATGETTSTVRCRGFGLLSPPPPTVSQRPHFALECPGCGADVSLTEQGLASFPELAECAVCDAAYPYEFGELFVVSHAPHKRHRSRGHAFDCDSYPSCLETHVP